MRRYLFMFVVILYMLPTKAQDKMVWLPGCKTTVCKIYNLLEDNIHPKTSKGVVTYEYDEYGRSLKSEPEGTTYSTYEYDKAGTIIPHIEKYYSWSFNENCWKYSYTREREIIRNEDGRTTRINVYHTNTKGKTNLCGYQTFEYNEDGTLYRYMNVPAINIFMDLDNMDGEDFYHKYVYTDFVWGDKYVDEPEVGSKEWQKWIVSPKSGLKSYTYTDSLIDVRNYVQTSMLSTKYTYSMNYSTDNYYYEESARLYGSNLQVTSVEYYDDLGSHSEKVCIYSGCNSTNDRDENKLTFVYSADTLYTSPYKYTVTHTENNIKSGITDVTESSTYENTYNSEYGYLEQTHGEGYEYTLLEESRNFEKTITYSDYKQYGTTAIQSVTNDQSFIDVGGEGRLYNIHGQRVSSDTSLLSPGIYITCGGKKILVK